MYARSTTVRGTSQAMDEGIAYVRDTVMPTIDGMDGCIGLSMLADRGSGRAIVTTSWRDHDALMDSADGVTEMRRRFAELMGGPAEVQEWEVVVMHRVHSAHHGAFARVIWSEGEAANLDQMADDFRMATLPRVAELAGFCSGSLMVERSSGRAVVTVTYDSPQDMAAAADPGMSLRQDFDQRTHRSTTDVGEFELVVAHLRLPETV